jgi:hypothetical protein
MMYVLAAACLLLLIISHHLPKINNTSRFFGKKVHEKSALGLRDLTGKGGGRRGIGKSRALALQWSILFGAARDGNGRNDTGVVPYRKGRNDTGVVPYREGRTTKGRGGGGREMARGGMAII